MKTRKLGSHGPEVSALGLGCMGMSEFYGESDEAASRALIRQALEAGVTFFDTADCYGAGHNERLLGAVLRDWSEPITLATKFGIVRRPGEYRRSLDNSAAYIRASVESSLSRLGRDHIELYYVHRLDPAVPVEETMEVLARLVEEGKIGGIGLSEVSARTIERAHAVHPVTAVQSEYSLFTRDAEREVLPTLDRLGIAFVPYSPLGRGMLTGKLSPADLQRPGDFRGRLPRTSAEHFEHNAALVRRLEVIAASIGASSAQLALAWVISKGKFIVPIPGTRKLERLRENIGACELALSVETRDQLEALFPPGAVEGERYTPEGMVGVDA